MFKKKVNKDYESCQDVNEHYDLNEYYNEPDVDEILDDICPKPKQKRKKSSDQYYVKGSDLLEEIKKYQQSKKEDAEKRGVPLEEGKGIISEQLGIMIMKICTRFSLHPKFFRLYL